MKCLEKLGSGGFSDVWLYEQDHPKLRVAVKLLTADVLDDVQRRQFADEADTMAELAEHPFIVPVLGAGTASDGRPYLVMRYYPPPDLGKRVAETQMTVAAAVRTGIQLASAVETAHRTGIIHRDIKPANVLISSYGVPGLTDFGIAGRGDQSEDGEHLGVSMPWSPPEVLSGQSNGNAVSDVYSLAATVWNLLVGRSPFSVPGDNSDRALFTRILHSKPPATGRADVPSSLDRLLQQAMAKRPEQRPQSAMELARHLQRVEQELRFDRTEIVVLEAPTPVSESSAPVALVEESDDTGVTMLRRPARVVPTKPPTPKAPEETETTRRPATVAPRDGQSELTMRKGPATPSTSPGMDEPEPAAPGGLLKLIAAGAVVLVLVITIGIALGVAGGGDKDNETLPDPPGPSDIGDVVDDFKPVSTPEITVTAKTKNLVFSATAEEPTDLFEWRVTFKGETTKWSENAGNKPDELRTGRPEKKGETVCVELRVTRDGQLSQPGQECWP
ncbi:serine/threonine-protein kinase [Nocardioides sp.]|uniref:serine/threonine-protein kinase n=1 Tax=Nocardioides sp. TaxID=35761 RepID=UPI0027323B98|nr:serine/threonine-protein kinase [Nocardioides sp.]MDP3890429.1 serine/threonine-protein kinase [Nocardioides sp.]